MQLLKNIWNRLPNFFKNKYLLVSIVFLIWLIFFDHNNLINQWQTKSELDVLIEKRNFYNKEITEINQTKESLFSDAQKLEQFAREKYLMKKNNEDIFIIERDTVLN